MGNLRLTLGDCYKFTLADGTEVVIKVRGTQDINDILGQPWTKCQKVNCSDHGMRDSKWPF